MTRTPQSLICGLMALSMVTASHANSLSHKAIEYHYYPVEGATFHALRDSLNRNGPHGFHAYTAWHVSWQYDYAPSPKQCGLTNIQVTQTANITFPEWNRPLSASSPLQQAWQRYANALMEHELGHVKHGQLAKQAIEAHLKELSPATNCKAISRKANAGAYKILHHYQTEDKNYDRQTQHGKTQGAWFTKTW